jgi:hypothetical protein
MSLMGTGSNYGKFCIKEAVCNSVSVCIDVMPVWATPRIIDAETYKLKLSFERSRAFGLNFNFVIEGLHSKKNW